MKKPNNKAIAIYLAWGLLHLALLFYNKPVLMVVTMVILVFLGAVGYPYDGINWDVEAYDLTEFAFYMIAPILIYYIITLLKTKDEADK